MVETLSKEVKWIAKTRDGEWVEVANEAEARLTTWSRGEYGVIIGDRYILTSPKRIYQTKRTRSSVT